MEKNTETNLLLEGEFTLLNNERMRRSSEQAEILRFVRVGILTQVALVVFELMNLGEKISTIFNKKNTPEFEEMISLGLIIVGCGVVLLTMILFFFWLDHALTISAIDHFFREKEKSLNVSGWYSFREEFSKKMHLKIECLDINLMNIKYTLFKCSIWLSFILPPLLFMGLSFISIFRASHHVPQWLTILFWVVLTGLFVGLLGLTIWGLIVWHMSSRKIYFQE